MTNHLLTDVDTAQNAVNEAVEAVRKITKARNDHRAATEKTAADVSRLETECATAGVAVAMGETDAKTVNRLRTQLDAAATALRGMTLATPEYDRRVREAEDAAEAAVTTLRKAQKALAAAARAKATAARDDAWRAAMAAERKLLEIVEFEGWPGEGMCEANRRVLSLDTMKAIAVQEGVDWQTFTFALNTKAKATPEQLMALLE
jgi:hypothetical protein